MVTQRCGCLCFKNQFHSFFPFWVEWSGPLMIMQSVKSGDVLIPPQETFCHRVCDCLAKPTQQKGSCRWTTMGCGEPCVMTIGMTSTLRLPAGRSLVQGEWPKKCILVWQQNKQVLPCHGKLVGWCRNSHFLLNISKLKERVPKHLGHPGERQLATVLLEEA